MAYREDHGWNDVPVLTFDVTVRVEGHERTERVTTGALDPMGQVQASIAEERGIRFDEVHPVTYRVVPS